MRERVIPVPTRAPLLIDRRVMPMRPRRQTGRPPAAGWLAPVYQLRPGRAGPPWSAE